MHCSFGCYTDALLFALMLKLALEVQAARTIGSSIGTLLAMNDKIDRSKCSYANGDRQSAVAQGGSRSSTNAVAL